MNMKNFHKKVRAYKMIVLKTFVEKIKSKKNIHYTTVTVLCDMDDKISRWDVVVIIEFFEVR